MSSTLTYEETVIIVHCGSCGGPIAMAASFQRERREDHQAFYCPAGHGRWYPGETEAEKLQKKLAWAQDLANAEAEKRKRAEALLASVEARRMVRAPGTGEVCGICNRKVRNINMRRHMATKHPEEAQHD